MTKSRELGAKKKAKEGGNRATHRRFQTGTSSSHGLMSLSSEESNTAFEDRRSHQRTSRFIQKDCSLLRRVTLFICLGLGWDGNGTGWDGMGRVGLDGLGGEIELFPGGLQRLRTSQMVSLHCSAALRSPFVLPFIVNKRGDIA